MDNKKTESSIRKVALTSLSGTSIEWSDFFLYGAAAGLVFPKLFFGEVDPTTALILSFMTFAAGFIARPVGGIIFGHFGDLIGRRKTLVVALMLMGPGCHRTRHAGTRHCSGLLRLPAGLEFDLITGEGISIYQTGS